MFAAAAAAAAAARSWLTQAVEACVKRLRLEHVAIICHGAAAEWVVEVVKLLYEQRRAKNGPSLSSVR